MSSSPLANSPYYLKPSSPKSAWQTLVGAFVVYSLVSGYVAGSRPNGQWRYFSWHPFLMTCGMVGCSGIAAVTKKMGGYANTKNHGYIANFGAVLSLAGLYIIYQNKEMNGSKHFTTYHGKIGLALIVSCIGLGMVGGVVLHPDFGVDKTNQTIRFVHRTSARIVLATAWIFSSYTGMSTLTTPSKDPMAFILMLLPLLVLLPVTLM